MSETFRYEGGEPSIIPVRIVLAIIDAMTDGNDINAAIGKQIPDNLTPDELNTIKNQVMFQWEIMQNEEDNYENN